MVHRVQALQFYYFQKPYFVFLLLPPPLYLLPETGIVAAVALKEKLG